MKDSKNERDALGSDVQVAPDGNVPPRAQVQATRIASYLRLLFEHRRDVAQLLSDKALLSAVIRNADFVRTALTEKDYIDRVLDNKDFITEVNRLNEFISQVFEERYWLEDALEHKTFTTRMLDQRRGEAKAADVFREELAEFRRLNDLSGARLPARDEDILPQLSDRTGSTPFDRHYLYHPAWAARILAQTKPSEHVDIGSILQFVTMISAFVPTKFYDFRPATLELSGLSSGAADLTALPFADGSIASLSCMHVLEHIGLGRYGDPIDPGGDLRAIRELVRVLAPGGDLLVATPVGRPRIQFNAHRVYDFEAFASYFAPLELVEFALIEETGERGLIVNPSADLVRAQSYGCGCFWLRRAA